MIPRKRKQEEHEDRKKAIREAGNATYGQLQTPPVVAPVAVGPTYMGGTYGYIAEDARSQNGYMPYGMRQTGNPTPPGTLHGYGPTYAQNPGPSMCGTANPNKAVYYDEKEPDYPTYGTRGYGGGVGLYGTGAMKPGGSISVFQGNYNYR